jgi:hypothetical protein
MIELAEKYTTYGDCEFQDKQHLKEPVIFSEDIATRDGFEISPCWKAIIMFCFVLVDILDRCNLEISYVGR